MEDNRNRSFGPRAPLSRLRSEGAQLRKAAAAARERFVDPLQGAADMPALMSFLRRRSPFANWSRAVIIETLVHHGVEIRDEQVLDKEQIIMLADETFDSEATPEPVEMPTVQRLEQLHRAAIVVQNAWFNRMIKQAEGWEHDQSLNENYRSLMLMNVHAHSSEDYANEEMDSSDDEDVDENVGDLSGVHMQSAPPLGEFKRSPMDMLKRKWNGPNVQHAEKFAKYRHPLKFSRDGEPYPIWGTTTGRHCVHGGCGEQLDFWREGAVSELGKFGPGVTNYFKFLKWATWVFFLASLLSLPMVVLNAYGPAQDEEAQTDELSLSATTVGNLGGYTNATVDIPGCSEDSFHSYSCTYDKTDLAKAYVWIDVIFGILFLAASRWLKSFEKEEALFLNRKTVSASAYTVRVPRLPETCTEAELRAHFAELTGCTVADVNIGFRSGDMINLYRTRGLLCRKRERVANRIRYIRTVGANHRLGKQWRELRRLPGLMRQFKSLCEKIVRVERRAKIVDRGSEPITAFITFESVKGYLKAIAMHKLTGFQKLCPPQHIRFHEKVLRVVPATDPSTVLWENLEYSLASRTRRKTFSMTIALVALFVSLVVGVAARIYQQEAALEGGDEICPSGFTELSEDEQRAAVEEDPEIIHCYCDRLSEEERQNDDLCQEYEEAKRIATILMFAAAMITMATNFAVEAVMVYMARYEKHHSKDNLEQSLFRRVFILKALNLGVLPLLYNLRIVQEIGGNENVQVPEDFNTLWYETTGGLIMLNMMANIVAPHLYKFFLLWRKHRRIDDILQSTDVALTQRELNEAFLGPEFDISLRYAQIVATIFVCMMYSAGMPMLNVICFLSMLMFYWVDKLMFLRLWRTPPYYSARLGKAATSLLDYAVLVHVGMAMWMFGNNEIFSSEGAKSVEEHEDFYERYDSFDVRSRLSQRHLLPMLIFIGSIVGYYIVRDVTRGATHFTRRFINLITCWTHSDVRKVAEHVSDALSSRVTYSHAKRRRLIRGLTSYNILQNPVYKDIFHISDKFASAHKHLTSIAKFEEHDHDDSGGPSKIVPSKMQGDSWFN